MPSSISGLQAPPLRVSSALQTAASKTGADFQYLYKVAARESSLNPDAKAKTSSATGLFQFIEQTWLGAVKNFGAEHGLAKEAAQISRGADGRFQVGDAAARAEILNLRKDPDKASLMAGELAMENKGSLEKRLGRDVSGPELYAAHFLGPSGAVKLLSAPQSTPAADLVPAAARANHNVFYDGDRSKSVAEVVDSFRKTIGVANAARDRALAAAPNTSTPPVNGGPFLTRRVQSAAPLAPSTPVKYVQNRAGQINSSAARVDEFLRQFGGKSPVSPLALMVLEAIDPTKLSGTLR